MLVNGWNLYTSHLFDEQYSRLIERVEASAQSDPAGYSILPVTKLLASIERLTRELIPANPTAPEYRQANTLGKDNKHWFRAKFHERYRLFFRFSSKDRVIVYAWVNDESTLRKAGSKRDPSSIFQTMLESGDPPRNLQELLAVSRKMK